MAIALLLARIAVAADNDELHRVTFKNEKQQLQTIQGRIEVEAVDGGLLLVTRDGRLWTITPDQLQNRESTGESFEAFNAEEIQTQLAVELGNDFDIHSTRHYVICSNAGRHYTKWCGNLFERLYAAFRRHWRTSRLGTDKPEFPLQAIVFANRKQFADYASQIPGVDAATSKGFFSARTNRIVLYDLTASENGRAARNAAEVRRKVQQSPFNVATVVHEATHQIAFNTGIHTRYADNPLWLTEGLAMYFETPDLENPAGWRSVGKANRWRLEQLRQSVQAGRQQSTLAQLLTTDDLLREAETAADAYATAWAYTYFLIKTRRKAYVEYLRGLSTKTPLVWDTPEQRLADFRAAFGENPDRLERDFHRYMERSVRR